MVWLFQKSKEPYAPRGTMQRAVWYVQGASLKLCGQGSRLEVTAGALGAPVCRSHRCVAEVPKEELSLNDGASRTYLKDEVRFYRLARPLADALVIQCGDEHRLIVDSSVAGTFAGCFGPVLESLGLDDALDPADNA